MRDFHEWASLEPPAEHVRELVSRRSVVAVRLRDRALYVRETPCPFEQCVDERGLGWCGDVVPVLAGGQQGVFNRVEHSRARSGFANPAEPTGSADANNSFGPHRSK